MGELADYYAEENAVVLMAVTSYMGSNENTGSVAYSHATTYFPDIEFVTGDNLPAGNAGVPFSAVIDLETGEVLGRDIDQYDFLSQYDIYHLVQDANAD